MAKRRRFTPEFKAEVVLEALSGQRTVSPENLTSAKTKSQRGNANFLKMPKLSLSRQISSQASQRSGSLNWSNSFDI